MKGGKVVKRKPIIRRNLLRAYADLFAISLPNRRFPLVPKILHAKKHVTECSSILLFKAKKLGPWLFTIAYTPLSIVSKRKV